MFRKFQHVSHDIFVFEKDVLLTTEKLDKDVALHLAEIKAYKSGTVALRYEVRGAAA